MEEIILGIVQGTILTYCFLHFSPLSVIIGILIYLIPGMLLMYGSIGANSKKGVDLMGLTKDLMAQKGLDLPDRVIEIVIYFGVFYGISVWPWVLFKAVAESVREARAGMRE